MDWGWQAEAHASSLAAWLALAAVAALTVLGIVLNGIILRKAGYHWLWSVLFLFPLAYLIGIWVFAWGRWPRLAAATVIVRPEGATGEGGVGGRRDGEPPFIGPDPNPRRSFSDRRRW